jgi:hypothetical protein
MGALIRLSAMVARNKHQRSRFASVGDRLDGRLEDAGCADADILTHCRRAGVHVRGCWVVDLLLEKQ